MIILDFAITLPKNFFLMLIVIGGITAHFKKKSNIGHEAAFYWLNGIPQSDDGELKKRTLKTTLFHITQNTGEFRILIRILRPSNSEVCTKEDRPKT